MKAAGVSLLLSALALAFAGVAMTTTDSNPQARPPRLDRMADFERRMDELSQEIMLLRTQFASPAVNNPAPSSSEGSMAKTSDVSEAAWTPSGTTNTKSLEAIVDAAVNKKTAHILDQMRIKQNKKPEFGAFASVLELTDEQRQETERVVVEGQREVHSILNTPTANGTNLMDGLIEIVAKGFVTPGKDNGWGAWVGRVMNETIPGTQESYGARIESVKNGMRESFKREWTEKQYREFEQWGVDPTEIQKVPGSPNDELWKRVSERARELGAKIPENEPK